MAVIGAVTISMAQGSAAAQPSRLPVVIRVDDRAGVEKRQLADAKSQVERIFRKADVSVEWQDGSPSFEDGRAIGGRRIVVTLLNSETAGPEARPVSGCALGQAVRSTGHAYVFYNRLAGESLTRPVDLTVMLAYVVAHEVGHLLLPPNSHSRYGIMQASLDFTFGKPHQFTAEQAAMMRDALADAAHD
jgi:hypothetical protein